MHEAQHAPGTVEFQPLRALNGTNLGCCMKETRSEEAVKDALGRARDHSPFLRLQLERFPDLAEALEAGRAEEAMARAARAGSAAGDLGAALRMERSALAAALAVADLAGAIPLERLMEALADLADRALSRALAAAFAERTPDDAPRGFAVIALGKHG